MNDEEREIMLAAINREARRMKRDKKYAHQVYMEHGIMPKKGNLTRGWYITKEPTDQG